MNFEEMDEYVNTWLDDYRPMLYDCDCHKDTENYEFYVEDIGNTIIIRVVEK